MDIHSLSVVMIGAGNVATHLSLKLKNAGVNIRQVYSRTIESASTLACLLNTEYTTNINEVANDACLYIVSVKDSVLHELLPLLVKQNKNALYVHTAGSVSIDIWKNLTDRYGVLYPMQTFSKQREVDFNNVHFFIEANTDKDTTFLKNLASMLSPNVYEASSEQRKYLHISAVFACNFTNHMYAVCEHLLCSHGLPFKAMLPLIYETAMKAHSMSPVEGQTGPAQRNDSNIMEQHIKMLENEPELAKLYKDISENIRKYASNKKQHD